MVDMHTGEVVLLKSRFPDVMKGLLSHLFIGRVFDALHDLAVYLIGTYLAQENAMGTNVGFGLMVPNRGGDLFRGDRAVNEYFFWLSFFR